jgi:hypothetical protein
MVSASVVVFSASVGASVGATGRPDHPDRISGAPLPRAPHSATLPQRVPNRAVRAPLGGQAGNAPVVARTTRARREAPLPRMGGEERATALGRAARPVWSEREQGAIARVPRPGLTLLLARAVVSIAVPGTSEGCTVRLGGREAEEGEGGKLRARLQAAAGSRRPVFAGSRTFEDHAIREITPRPPATAHSASAPRPAALTGCSAQRPQRKARHTVHRTTQAYRGCNSNTHQLQRAAAVAVRRPAALGQQQQQQPIKQQRPAGPRQRRHVGQQQGAAGPVLQGLPARRDPQGAEPRGAGRAAAGAPLLAPPADSQSVPTHAASRPAPRPPPSRLAVLLQLFPVPQGA